MIRKTIRRIVQGAIIGVVAFAVFLGCSSVAAINNQPSPPHQMWIHIPNGRILVADGLTNTPTNFAFQDGILRDNAVHAVDAMWMPIDDDRHTFALYIPIGKHTYLATWSNSGYPNMVFCDLIN
jgi:hypothetical protein